MFCMYQIQLQFGELLRFSPQNSLAIMEIIFRHCNLHLQTRYINL